MRLYRCMPVFIGTLLATGCGPVLPDDVRQPDEKTPNTSAGQPQKIAGDTGTARVAMPYDAPPHVFTPRSHPARYRHGDPKPPNLKTLPKLKMRFGKCFGVKKDKRPAQIASGSRGGYPIKAKKSAKAVARTKPEIKGRSRGKEQSKDAYIAGAGTAAEPIPSADVAGEAPASVASAMPPQPAAEMTRAEEAEAESAPRSRDEDAKLQIAGDDSVREVADDQPPPSDYEDWGAAIYLSNDDTMSLSSAQRVIYAIDNFLPLPLGHIRPHELLNYFSFDTANVTPGNDFSVFGEIADDPREKGIHTLGLAIRGRPIDKESRRNAAVTLVIDRSGSMQDEGRMDYLRQGLERMLGELKNGDMVNVVLFDHNVCVPAENFVIGRDDTRKLLKIIKALRPRGSTDLHRGLTRGYEIADRAYRSEYNNRVVMITDALTNTGITDQMMISMISKYYDKRRIRLSGVGVGRDFNDALLDRLTEQGKGAYVFLGSKAEVDAVFGSHFISLIETAALDVHFRLHLPPSLRMNVFYGEESSTVKEDVQEIHYFAGTSQLFLSDLMTRGSTLRHQDEVMLSIEYKDPETGEELVEEYAFNLGELALRGSNVKKARLIMAWIDMLAQMAERSGSHIRRAHIHHRNNRIGSWKDTDGWHKCEDGKKELDRLSKDVSDDPEVRRVIELWEKCCARYERPRNPVKRRLVPKNDSWPGAKPSGRR
ncbi:MAG: VWA domain-containing protein [Proteobacteria bacterium]|nr:VWA domain-containing protein [Pseudomonadota bacterium]